jgi:hypothetical protein
MVIIVEDRFWKEPRKPTWVQRYLCPSHLPAYSNIGNTN